MLPIISVAALADSINPCAISVLVLTIGFLFSIQKKGREIITIGLTYITGIYVTYISIGMGILRALTFFGIPRFLGKFGASFIILAGVINLINIYFPKFPIKLKMPESSHPQIAKFMSKGTIPAAAIMGVLVGLYEFPCTGGPYLTILGLLHDKASFMQGFFYLIYYNLIFVLPLIVILLVSSRRDLFDRFQAFRSKKFAKYRFLDSLIMIGLGLIIWMT